MLRSLLLWGISCSVVAQVKELDYGGITAWHDSCEDVTSDLCGGAGEAIPLADPLYFEYDWCYSNPHLERRSVSFFGPDESGKPQMYNIIFINEDGLFKYSPTGCDKRGQCPCNDPPALGELRDQILADKASCTDPGGVLTFECEVKPFTGDTSTCWVPSFVSVGKFPNGHDFYCSMVADIDVFPSGLEPTSEPADQDNEGTEPTPEPADQDNEPTPEPADQDNEPTPEPADQDDGTDPFPVDTISKKSEKASELDYTAITGWWNGCTIKESDNNADDECTEATNIRITDPLYLDLETCYSNPNLAHHSVSFFLKDDNGQAYSYHVLFDSSASWDDFKPICDHRGKCSCESSGKLSDYRKSLFPAQDCVGGTGFTCKRDIFVGFSSDCYVPAQDIFFGELVCSMAASLQQIPFSGDDGPGDGLSNQAPTSSSESDKGGLANWSVVGIVVAILCTVIFLLFAAMRFRPTRAFFSPDEFFTVDEDEEWVRSRSHKSKFTRRSMDTGEQGDGLWKKENMHDIKFQMTA